MNARSTDITKKGQRAGRLGGRKRSGRKATAVRATLQRVGRFKPPQSKVRLYSRSCKTPNSGLLLVGRLQALNQQ
jgi:hypothetical protein